MHIMGFDFLDSYMDDEITTLFLKKKSIMNLEKMCISGSIKDMEP